MRRYVTCLMLVLLGYFQSNAQLGIKFTGGNVDPNATIQVDVTVENFTQLSGFQFSVNYDSTVLAYTGASNITTAFGGDFDANSIISHLNNAALVTNGQVTANWFNGSTPATLANGTRLFTMNFTAFNVPCDSTDVRGSDIPITSSFINNNFEELPIVFTNSQIKVNGPNCGGGGPGPTTDLTFTVANRSVQNGQEVCIPITVQNFNGYNGGQGRFAWDASVLSFVRVQNVTAGMYNANADSTSFGRYRFLWENNDPSNPVVLPNGSTFMEVCFNVVGATGTMSTFDMNSFKPDWGFVDESGADIIPVLNNGKITVTAAPEVPVTINISDITINEGSKGCVSVTVDNFTNIQSFQGTFTWNNAVIAYDTVNGFGAIPGLDAADFNPSLAPNRLRVTWNNLGTQPITLNNGTEIFRLCFDAVADCQSAATSLVDFVDVTNNGVPFDVEFTRIVMGVAVSIDEIINEGSVAIAPCAGSTCTFVSKTNVSCNGGSNGAINVTVSPSSSSCQCVWYKDGATTPFRTLTPPNCNLTNAPAGTYRLDILCGNTVECTLTETISQPTPIVISESIVNIGCNITTGSITLTVTGGTMPYTYLWNDVSSSTTKDLTNLPAGNYTVTVTDANMCTNTKSVTISESVTPLNFTESVTSVACRGDNTGSIILNITGGCPQNGQYNITPAILTNLTAGAYTVTVEDFSNPPMQVTKTITVTQPDSVLSVTGTTTESSGADGTITTSVLGGTKPYTVTWTGGIGANIFNPTGLAPGTYTGTFTDANGCTVTEVYVVRMSNAGGSVTITNITVDDVSCFGFADGVVMGSITAGTPPFTVTLLSGTTSAASANVGALGPFMLNNVRSGNYTLRVTDNNGQTNTASVVVGTPTQIALDADITCANGTNNDGAIELVASGGGGVYTYDWSNGATSANLNNIGLGVYSVVVEDQLGCQAIANNLRVNDCNPTDCYEAMAIITPNNDGINDNFVINCVMQEQTKLTIYDRWGTEVYRINNYTNNWNGVNQNGEALPQSSYMWVLEVDFSGGRKEIFKGTVTVLTNE